MNNSFQRIGSAGRQRGQGTSFRSPWAGTLSLFPLEFFYKKTRRPDDTRRPNVTPETHTEARQK